MTQMSRGDDRCSLTRPFATDAEDQRKQRHHFYLARRRERQNTTTAAAAMSSEFPRRSIQRGDSSPLQQSRLSPSSDEVRRSADGVAGGTEVFGCSAARVLPYAHLHGRHAHTTRTDRPPTTAVVDEAELARRTREALVPPASVGRFYRTCCTTAEVAAPQTLDRRRPPLSNFVPLPRTDRKFHRSPTGGRRKTGDDGGDRLRFDDRRRMSSISCVHLPGRRRLDNSCSSGNLPTLPTDTAVLPS